MGVVLVLTSIGLEKNRVLFKSTGNSLDNSDQSLRMVA